MKYSLAPQYMSSCDILKCVVLLDSLVKEHQKKLHGVEEELYLDGVTHCLDTSLPCRDTRSAVGLRISAA
ncbi:MAG: hypothetical protein ACK50Y_02400 [Flavobacteriia bacterium]